MAVYTIYIMLTYVCENQIIIRLCISLVAQADLVYGLG